MLAEEIPRKRWNKFFDDFSRKHEGWIVTLEVLGSDLGDQDQAAGLPLSGISADLKDRESRIEIIVGGKPEAHLTHIIEGPKRIWVEESDEGLHEAVEVESEDGTATLVRFHRVRPEEAERQLSP